MRFLLLALLLLATQLPSSAHAQVGSTTDIIIGRVTNPEGQPVVGARVEVTSLESQIKRAGRTGADGRYTILFPDGGGNYALQVMAIGYSPARVAVNRQSDEDRLVADVRLGHNVAVLQSVEVRGERRSSRQGERPDPGTTERGFQPGLVNKLPVEAGDLNALAALVPGVVSIAGTDSTDASFSVAGQPSNENSITLDGLSFGSSTLPQEAIRGTRVVTNTYDVARGQFTGGQIATSTRGGTNLLQGAVNYTLRDPSLEFVQDEETTFSQKFTQNQINFGLGGPMVKDKFFIFGAAAYSRRTDPLQSLLIGDPLALQRIGASSDSVDRFLGILTKYGLQPTLPVIPDEKLSNNGSAIVRLDYNLGEGHSLMLRGDWRGSTQDANRISAFSVPHNGGNAKTSGGGGMITLTSHWGGVINELRGYSSKDVRGADPYLRVPSGRVVVASTLADGTGAVSTLQFGVNPALPQESQTHLTEVSDEVSRVSTGGAHRVKLGGLINQEGSESPTFPNALGTYMFNSLADFDAGLATQFSRTLTTRPRRSLIRSGALYLGDSWRLSPAFQLTYGLRLETSQYPNAPEFNPTVDSLFAHRTDFFPRETHLSPRAGFTYSYGGFGRNSLGSLRGGIGEFRGKAPYQLFSSAANANGLSNGQSQLVCVGPSVPAPNWPQFIANPSLVPSSCIGTSQQFGNQRRNVVVFAPDYAAPRAWRGSLGWTQRIVDRYTFSIDGSYSRGVAQSGGIDLNLNTTPQFRLASEGNRPVYTPVNGIVPTTGATALSGSRLEPRFGVVSELRSNLQSDTRQLSASVNGITRTAMSINLSYTFTQSRDLAGGLVGVGGGFGGGGGATTAGNPNIPQWGRSDLERRHAFLAVLSIPVHPAFDFSVISRLTSGGYFTPLVSGDINGDGVRNDRAFIFDPASAPDTAIGNGMARLLATGHPRAEDCLRNQFGKIAGRNSCSIPWSPGLDFQANIRPDFLGLSRRLTLSVLGVNTLTGIDRLLHGADNLRGWGQPVITDRTLLYVRGFDPVAQRFLYQVNEHFGTATGTKSAYRVPFQISVQGRLAIGTDPARQQMDALLGGVTGRVSERTAIFRDRLARSVPNVYRNILELNDSLHLELTPDQQAQLKIGGDSLQAKADTLIDALAQALGTTDRNENPMKLMLKMRDKVQEGRALGQKAVAESQKILSPEQWVKLPKYVREIGPDRESGEERRRPPGR